MKKLLEDVITAQHDSLPIGDNDAHWMPLPAPPEEG